MGFISDLAGERSPQAGRKADRNLWREAFGATSKEEGSRPRRSPQEANQWTRTAGGDSAFKRLLQAFRSRAPGGWSDDRYEQSRHFYGVPYVAIHRQNELLSQAEFQVSVKDPREPEGKRPVREGEEGWDLVQLLEHPNPDDSFGDLMAQWNLQLDLTGTALTWMVPNQLGNPYELYPISTATAVPQPTINPEYPDGFYRIQPLYPYGPFSLSPTPYSASGAPIPAQWMLRFKYPHPMLRYEGYSPLTALRFLIDEIEMVDRSRHYSMRGSINPSAVLNSVDAEGAEQLPEPEVDRIHAEWEAQFQGVENHGKLIVGSPGFKLEEWGRAPVDMDYQGGWDQLVSFVLGGMGITKPAAGMIEDSSYSTLFATLKQLYWLTLDPKCHRIGTKLTRYLAPFFGKNLIVEVRCRRIDDHEVRGATLDRLMTGKAITKNELRTACEYPVTKEKWGEEIAGDPSEKEQEQQQQEMQVKQQQAEKGPEGKRADVDTAGAGEEAEAERERNRVEKERPTPGNLSRGALGPRKHLNGKYTKRVAA